MKRFVTYIYAYEDKKKGNNIGFAKIEIRGEECRIEVHLRGAYVRQATCRVFLFRENTGAIEGVHIGEMKLINGNGDFSVAVKAGHLGESTLGIYNMEGLFLLGEDDSIFMSRWKEGNPITVCKEKFRIWRPQVENVVSPEQAKAVARMLEPEQLNVAEQVESHTTPRDIPSEIVESDTALQEKEEAPGQNRQSNVERRKQIEQAESVQATEIPMNNIFPVYDWKSVWESLTQNHTLYHPFEDREAECIQIELKHLRELPKRYWYLGNNSFLLHGFFNYRYLVVGRTGEGRWFIGVPGVYQRQERVMAAIFGFPEFMAMASSQGENAKSAEPINRFGCWYRSIEE